MGEGRCSSRDEMKDNGVPIIEHGLLAVSEAEWGLAVRNAALIAPTDTTARLPCG
jgi:hypothetical protein